LDHDHAGRRRAGSNAARVIRRHLTAIGSRWRKPQSPPRVAAPRGL